MHGHFQPAGAFMYCNTFEKDKVVSPNKFVENATLRLIPHLLAQENKHFSFKDTTFTMEQYKMGSARQVFFGEYKTLHSFTLENSFFKKQTQSDNEITSSSRIFSTLDTSGNYSQQKSRCESSPMLTHWDSKNSCYHFTANDHRQLGYDLGMVLQKALVPKDESANQAQIQKFMSLMHGKQLNQI
jgi:hypothetical protein